MTTTKTTVLELPIPPLGTGGTTDGYGTLMQAAEDKILAHTPWYTVGVSTGCSTFAAAVATLNALGTACNLVLPVGVHAVAADLTANNNIFIVPLYGCDVQIAITKTLTVNRVAPIFFTWYSGAGTFVDNGDTPNATELGYISGLTSAAQTQLTALSNLVSTGNDPGHGHILPGTITDAATIYPSSDGTGTGTKVHHFTVTALAQAAAFDGPTGTWVDGEKLVIRIKDAGVGKALDFTTSAHYTAIGVTLPTTTTASKIIYLGCVYNGVSSKWDVVAVTEQA